MNCIKLRVIFILLTLAVLSHAQKMEKVENLCPGLSMSKRTMIAVSSFTNSTNSSAMKPSGLSDMLSNALFNTGCFAVLERKNMSEVISEQDFSNSNRADKKTKIDLGKLKGASMVIMGNITELKEMESGGAVGGYFKKVAGGLGATAAHIGAIIKIVDVKTGMLIESKSFDKKVTSVGLAGGGVIEGIPVGGLGFKSKAMQDAVEKLIIEMVEYISSKKDYAENTQSISTSNGENYITIEIPSITYNDLNKLYKHLQSYSSYKDLVKTLENKVGNISFSASQSADKVADYLLDCKCGINLDITSVKDNLIVAKIEK